MEYRDSYGSARNNNVKPPDFTKCAAAVWDDRTWGDRQCGYKAKFDPDDQGKPTACGIHRKKPKAWEQPMPGVATVGLEQAVGENGEPLLHLLITFKAIGEVEHKAIADVAGRVGNRFANEVLSVARDHLFKKAEKQA